MADNRDKHNFRPGHRVRLLRRDGYGGFQPGALGTVTSERSTYSGNVKVNWDSHSHDPGFYHTDLERVVDPNESSKDILDYYSAITE